MKTRRLPEIDLARCVSLPAGTPLENELKSFNRGGGGWSYKPTRDATSDILSATSPLIGETLETSWDNISSNIKRGCNKGDDQISSNIGTAKILYERSKMLGWRAASHEMRQLSIGFGDSVRYWSNIVVEDANGPFIPFLDHRRSGGLEGSLSRQVVFSMQHVGVRDRDPDLFHFRLAVIRFPVTKSGRDMTVHFHDEAELLPYEELNNRVRVVYETWARVSEERAQEARATGTDGSTPFGDNCPFDIAASGLSDPSQGSTR